MRRIALKSATLLLGVALTVLADRIPAADPVPAYIASVIADPSRPDTDRQRDADRKPAEVIAFAGIKPGDKVADFMPGGGYFTRIFCKLVGDAGHVYAIVVPRPATAPAPTAPAVTEPAGGEACTNVTTSSLKMRLIPAPELHDDSDPGWVYEYWSSSPAAENFVAPEPLDVIWTSENYHDLHNKAFGSPDMLKVDTGLLTALRPGGVLIVEDHAAARGSGARDTASLHRIAAEQVKREVLEAGFEFVGESKVLRHGNDPHTANAHDMHDKTDRFLLKFRKP